MTQPAIGIVAVLDILGYKSFLANSSLEDAARLISDTLLVLPKEVPEVLHNSVRAAPVPRLDSIRDHEKILSRMKRVVFADTVLLALPLTPTADPALFLYELLPLVATASLVCRRFFDAGLPLRGAIALGGFVVHDHCFAGDAILKALEVGQRLELAGCALEDETRRAIIGAAHHASETSMVLSRFRRLIVATDVPTKSGIERMSMVRWTNPFDEWGNFPYDAAELVERSFSAHGKMLNEGARLKLKNTIETLRSSHLVKPD